MTLTIGWFFPCLWAGKDFNFGFYQIDDPINGHVGLGIDASFDVSILPNGAVRDLNKQANVGDLRMPSRIAAATVSANYRQIGFWLTAWKSNRLLLSDAPVRRQNGAQLV